MLFVMNIKREMGQRQLTIECSLNRELSRFKEPILGYFYVTYLNFKNINLGKKRLTNPAVTMVTKK